MIATLSLAALLLAMAAGQAASFTRFTGALATYGIPKPYTAAVAAGFVATEALAGVGLIADDTGVHTSAAALALTVATAWTILAAVALVQHRTVPNCGCFGAYAGQPLRPSVLAQDAVFVALAAWVLVG